MPRRHVETTPVFAGSEGESEEVFLHHLKKLYSRGHAFVTIGCAGGKNPAYIIEKSIRQSQDVTGCAGRKFILLDTDRPWSAKCVAMAEEHGFALVPSRPDCLEGMLLRIIGHAPVPRGTDQLKRLFRRTYNTDKECLQERTCERHFEREALEAARIRMSELDGLIKKMQGDFS